MAKLSPVKCRICGRQIDRNIEQQNIDWIMPSRNYFYCKHCYEDWRAAKEHSDDDWIDMIYDFIARDMRKPYDYWVCEAQRKKFLTQNMTNKGMYFALKYFYEVKGGNWESGHNSIGIVPYIYKESCTYWTEREQKQRGFMEELEKELIARTSREKIKIQKPSPKKKKVTYSLEDA